MKQAVNNILSCWTIRLMERITRRHDVTQAPPVPPSATYRLGIGDPLGAKEWARQTFFQFGTSSASFSALPPISITA
jgi:hypothetical protein